ncbi:MAG: hypothetical protein Q9218_004219, partial [Villophora microphyllina]
MARARQESSSSGSSSESESEESEHSPPPPRRRQTVAGRGNARQPQGRQPPRRASMPGSYPQEDDDKPARRAANRGGRVQRAPRQADSDDDEEPRPPPSKPGKSRGGPPPPVSRRAASADDGDDGDGDDGPRPSASAGCGGCGGRPRPIPTRLKPSNENVGEDEGYFPTASPRRRASTATRPGPDAEEIGSLRVRRPSANTDRRLKPSPGISSPNEPDLPTEEMNDEFRRALAVSAAEPLSARSREEEEYEEQMRQVMEASKAEATAQKRRASEQVDEEEQLRRLIEESEKEHKAQQLAKARREKAVAQRQEKEFERALRESKEAAQQSGHHKEENELERAIRLSKVTHNADVRRAAERMAQGRATAPQSPSWTESNLLSANHRGESSSAPATPVAAAPPEPAPKPAPQKPALTKPKRSVSQRIVSTITSSKKPTTKPRTTSALAPIPETAVAGPSSPSPATPPRSQAVIKKASTTTATTTPSETTQQASVYVPPKPPIKLERLIAMCERAFPPDRALATALRESQYTARVATVQDANTPFDPQLAAALAESAAHAQTHEDRPAGMEDVGLDDPPPEYHLSSNDNKIDPRKWTTSDYRREQPGTKKKITPEILEIMRLYAALVIYLKENERHDPLGAKWEKRWDREKQWEVQKLLLPSAKTAVALQKDKEEKEQDATPPEIASSLSEILRPA